MSPMTTFKEWVDRADALSRAALDLNGAVTRLRTDIADHHCSVSRYYTMSERGFLYVTAEVISEYRPGITAELPAGTSTVCLFAVLREHLRRKGHRLAFWPNGDPPSELTEAEAVRAREVHGWITDWMAGRGPLPDGIPHDEARRHGLAMLAPLPSP